MLKNTVRQAQSPYQLLMTVFFYLEMCLLTDGIAKSLEEWRVTIALTIDKLKGIVLFDL
jgi:hypothetical protein